MSDVSHRNPRTNETFGAVFRRGPAVADGGSTRERQDRDDDQMKDVDHTPRNETDPNRVWERGAEGDADVRSDGDE